MIASLRGVLIHKDDEGAIIECMGVGYGVAAPTQTLQALKDVGQEILLHVYTHVAEDALKLYAFASPQERRVFEVLLSTSGVGPRLALAILSTLSVAHLLRAIAIKDRGAFTRIPGVGPKKAERLMLELSGRMPKMQAPAFAAAAAPQDPLQDVASALTHLGFAPNQAADAARLAHEALPECTDVATLTRTALQRISQGPRAH